MKRSLVLLFLLFSAHFYSEAQETNGWDLGMEIQLYPTGIIPGIRAAYHTNPKDEIHLRLGYQFIDHRDLGVQAEEAGNGWGFTLGYRRYLKPTSGAWSIGIRSDLWWNSIDWNNGQGSIPYYFGTTDLLVLQPTAEVAYTFLLENGGLSICPSIAFGYEMNIVTKGEPTGEGAILLVGVLLSQRF